MCWNASGSALRLRLLAGPPPVERGYNDVTIEAIADAAEVSRRTFSNYFANKEDALLYGDRTRNAALVENLRRRPDGESPWQALSNSAMDLYDGEQRLEPGWVAQLRLLRRHPALVAQQVGFLAGLEQELAGVLVARPGGADPLTARVMAAAFLAALRSAVNIWLEDQARGPLPDLVRAALDRRASPFIQRYAHRRDAAGPRDRLCRPASMSICRYPDPGSADRRHAPCHPAPTLGDRNPTPRSIMTTEWAVVPGGDQFTLDAHNKGEMVFTVSNPGSVQDTVVFDVLPGEGSQRTWFEVPEPQRPVAPNESVTFHVKLDVPVGTAARRYDVTGLAYSANTAPEESSRTSGRVSYEVATTEKPKKKIPWLFIIIGIVLVLVVAGVVFMLTRDSGVDTVHPPTKPIAAKASDVTGDGKADLAATGVLGWTTLPVAASKGDGTFEVTNEALHDFPALAATSGAKGVMGDFNGDGKADIALAGGAGWTGVPIAFSNGNGTFEVTNKPAPNIPAWAAAGGAKLLAGDFNGDGRDDLLITGGAGWSSIPVAFSNGDGTFKTTNEPAADVPGWAATANVKIMAADFNGDGKADLALAGGPGWNTVPVALSKGDGTFTVSNLPGGDVAFWAAVPGVKLAAGDVDGDGKGDIVITGGAGWGSVPVAFSAGDGTFRVTNNPAGGMPIWATNPTAQLVVADFNGDGKADFALTGGFGWGSIPVAFSKGNGTFDVSNAQVENFPLWAAAPNVKVL
jgi:AcrR family transcriptional regulator